MTDAHEPTETVDATISVYLLNDTDEDEVVECGSYEEAIQVVKDNRDDVTIAKIEGRDGEVVFSSAKAEIEDWVRVWRHEKARLGVDVPEHDCPYDNLSCFADDLCVQCKMDTVQQWY